MVTAMHKVFLYDTTLRDGTQAEDVSFSVDDKVRIIQALDEFGIDYVEGGWPGSNPRDAEFFARVRRLHLRHTKPAAFGSTRRAQNRPGDDPNLRALLESETPVVTIFGKSWLLHVRTALRISDDQNIELIGDSVRHLVEQGREVIYDAEHFFDGYRDNPAYALQSLAAAKHGGANMIVLCDTNGGSFPDDVARIVHEVRAVLGDPVGIHTHNDGELAVANAIAAVRSGAVHVQGTINGYGERCGNANLCSIIPNLQLKLGFACVQDDQLSRLTDLSRFVAELANLAHGKHLPYVGQSAFAHKGGVHVSAVMKESTTYEHIDPARVGNRRRVLVSDLSGKSNVAYKAEELGIHLEERSPDAQKIVDAIKAREFDGYHYEDADGSLAVLISRIRAERRDLFELGGFKVMIHKDSSDEEPVSEASIKVRVGGQMEHTAAEGNGPVNALDNALRKALEKFYPDLKKTVLADYKVRVLDGLDGTRAKVRVLITTKDETSSWNTVGVSTNIIEASWKALVDGLVYYFMKESMKPVPASEPH